MSAITRGLKHVVRGRSRTQDVYECRHCGTTVDGPGDTCPSCDSGQIARYRVS